MIYTKRAGAYLPPLIMGGAMKRRRAFSWTPVLTGVSRSSGGRQFSKTAATAAWDSAVHDATLRTGNILLEFVVPAAGGDVMMGLNTDPASAATNGSLDYAIYHNDSGNMYSSISGTLVLLAASVGTAKMGIRKVGTVLTFEKDGVVMATEAVADVGYALDSSFYTQGKAIDLLYYGSTA